MAEPVNACANYSINLPELLLRPRVYVVSELTRTEKIACCHAIKLWHPFEGIRGRGSYSSISKHCGHWESLVWEPRCRFHSPYSTCPRNKITGASCKMTYHVIASVPWKVLKKTDILSENKYRRDLQVTYKRFQKEMNYTLGSNLARPYVRANLLRICSAFAHDLLKICSWFAQDLLKRWANEQWANKWHRGNKRTFTTCSMDEQNQ